MLKKWWANKGAPTPRTPATATMPAAAGDVPSRAAQPPGPPARTAQDDLLLDKIAAGVVRFGMTVPAIFLLESSKPLSFVGGQFLHFLSPIVGSIVDSRELDRLACLLERRDTVEELLLRIERTDRESSDRNKPERGRDGGGRKERKGNDVG